MNNIVHKIFAEIDLNDPFFQADFGSSGFDELVSDVCVVFCSVDGRIGDAEGGLGSHAGLECILD